MQHGLLFNVTSVPTTCPLPTSYLLRKSIHQPPWFEGTFETAEIDVEAGLDADGDEEADDEGNM